MAKRVGLPGADVLFRGTEGAAEKIVEGAPASEPVSTQETSVRATSPKGATGRVKHDQKITVYFSEDELLELEHANLMLRKDHGIRIDRGRLVRLAIAITLHDFEERGADSKLVQELQ